MTPQQWDSVINCFQTRTRDAVQRVALATSYAIETHPDQPIGPQLIYDAWVELNGLASNGRLDARRNELFQLKASMGTVAQYCDLGLAYAESIRAAASDRSSEVAGDQEPIIQQALDSTKAAIDRIAGLIIEQRARIEAEAKSKFQAVLDQQFAAADAKEQQLAREKAGYLQIASESRQFSERCDELQVRLTAVEDERDQALASGEMKAHSSVLHETRAAALEAQLATLGSTHDLLRQELTRERARADELADRVAQAAELSGQCTTLGERLATLESLLVETERRCLRERAVDAADFAKKLQEEREAASAREARLLSLIASFTSIAGERNDR